MPINSLQNEPKRNFNDKKAENTKTSLLLNTSFFNWIPSFISFETVSFPIINVYVESKAWRYYLRITDFNLFVNHLIR